MPKASGDRSSGTLAMRLARTGILVSALPNLFLLVLFYSLAWHMFRALGGWPSSIGDHGFPRPLVAHADITMYYFVGLIWFGMFIWPVAVLLCVVVPRWREFIPYLGLYGALFLSCLALMQLVPEQFLNWWRD